MAWLGKLLRKSRLVPNCIKASVREGSTIVIAPQESVFANIFPLPTEGFKTDEENALHRTLTRIHPFYFKDPGAILWMIDKICNEECLEVCVKPLSQRLLRSCIITDIKLTHHSFSSNRKGSFSVSPAPFRFY